MVSGTKTLAADPLNPVNCEVEPPWIGLVCPAHPTEVRLDLGIWRPSQNLELVAFLIPFLKQFFFVEGYISLLKDATAIRDYSFHEKGVHALQQSLSRWYMSK